MKCLILTLLLPFLFSSPAHAKKPLTLKWISDLDFGIAIQGDLAQTVPPGSSENSSNASFSVQGSKNSTYSIVLPSSPVTLSDGNGHTINVTNFQSNPPAGGNGNLGSTGTQMIFIGATLDSISISQPRGTYGGSFAVTVIYL